VHGVTDLASGKPLDWRIVSSAEAAGEGLLAADHEGEFIRVALARPVPAGGEGRIRIDKTYRDPASVFLEDGKLIFERTLGVRRNSVVLPAVYLPVTVMLLALIFRGTAFEFRWVAKPHHRKWDYAFAGGSTVAAFAQGVVLGTLL